MTDERLQMFLEEHSEMCAGRNGCWRVEYQGRPLVVASDAEADRMRIMAPIKHDAFLDEFDYQILLRANFDRTLDARYAVAGGYVWAVFLHPLSQMTETLVAEGLRQVHALAENYGDSYAVGELMFTGCS